MRLTVVAATSSRPARSLTVMGPSNSRMDSSDRCRGAAVLADGPGNGGAELPVPDLAAQLRQHCLSYCCGLELHHIREDGTFSAFEQQYPHLIPVISRLRSEHRTMARALASLETLLTATTPADTGEILAALDDAITGMQPR
jgi:hypothetical protein